MSFAALTGIFGRIGRRGGRKSTPAAGHPGSRRIVVEPLEERRLLSLGGLSAAESVTELDFGDAPDNYGTTLAADGARHSATGPTLGALRDSETDGLPTPTADGDDRDGTADEDGVTFGSTIMVGQLDAVVVVNVQNAPSGAKLDAWIDFNGDGSWSGPGEQIAAGVDVIEGNNALSFDVPSFATAGETYVRFRLSTSGSVSPTGPAADGEVEDHLLTISSAAATDGNFGPQNEHSNAPGHVNSVFVADINGDGHMDALSASNYSSEYGEGIIAWYENDGSQNLTIHEIFTSRYRVSSVFAVEINCDGHVDVLSASSLDDKIVWHENDGSEGFTTHLISDSTNGLSSIFAADINGDGHMDVLSASSHDDKIAWYENDGSQSFTTHVISTSADHPTSVFAADVNGDGHIDVLSASSHDDKIAWYENDRSQSFTTHVISTSADRARSVFAADINGDGSMDVLSASSDDDKIAWYENDGSQNFTTRLISTTTDEAWLVFAADINGDGHMDVLSASGRLLSETIAWHENNGSQDFTTHEISTKRYVGRSIFAADVDRDGDLDVLSTSSDGRMAWYENLGNEAVHLGTVSFLEVADLDPSTGDLVYRFTTANNGYLTVDATFDPAAGTVELELLDATKTPVGTLTTEDGYLRIDHVDPTGGNVYTVRLTGTNVDVDLRICNLVEHDGSVVTVQGTEGEDVFRFTGNAQVPYVVGEIRHDVDINGISYSFNFAPVPPEDFLMTFHGGPGDQASLTGYHGDIVARLEPARATVSGAGFQATVLNTPTVSVSGRGTLGADTVEMFDSTGDDTLSALSDRFILTGTPVGGETFTLTARHFLYAHAYAKNGGRDVANFLGSPLKDRLKVYPNYLKMIGGNYYNRAKFFESYTADARSGTNSMALVYGSDKADVLWAKKNELRMDYDTTAAPGDRPPFENLTYDILAYNFENVRAYAYGDAKDWAELHDTALNDVLIAKPHKAEIMNGPRKADGVLRGDEYKITARKFSNVTAIGDTGDIAKLYDSGDPGIDVWAADYRDAATWSAMTSPTRLLYEVLAFERVGGYGFNGELGPNHGRNVKDHSGAVDFAFQHGYWEE